MLTTYTMDHDQLMTVINQVKETVVESLVEESFMTEGEAKAFLSSYVVILHKKGLLGKMMDKVMGYKDDKLCLDVVRVVGRPDLVNEEKDADEYKKRI